MAVTGLVLGGGGSRGWAHAGALLGLEQRGHDPDVVVGTSIGALVGALYAAGYTPEEIQERIRREAWGQIFTPAPLVLGPEREARFPLLVWDRDVDPLRYNRGIVPQWRINRALVELLFDSDARSRGDFDRLARRFRAVAADLRTGDTVVLARGDLARAVRASMAVPGVFSPVAWGTHSLIDGGIASNLPVPVARELGAARVIAVDIGRPEEEVQGRSPLQVLGRTIDLLQASAERGTPPADVTVVPDIDPGFYGITFPADPDPLFRTGLAAALRDVPAVPPRPERRPLPPAPRAFGELRIEAPDSATAALARQVFRKAVRGPYDPDCVLRAVSRLYTTGLFEGIWPRVEGEGPEPALVVRVEAQPAISIAAGLGYDTDRGGRLWAAWQRNRALLGAPAVLTAALSLDPLEQWATGSLRVHPLRLSPLVASAGAYARETDARFFRDDESTGDADVVRLGGWAGVEYQELLADRVGAATLRVERIAVEDGRTGFSAGPYLRIAGPQAETPVVGGPLEAEAEARWGGFSYRRAAAQLSVERRIGELRLAAVGDVATTGGDVPPDVLPALGDDHRMPGYRWGEGRGRSRVMAGLDVAHRAPFGGFARVRARVGGVSDGLGDFGGAGLWVSGVEVGGLWTTPFGAVTLGAGFSSAGDRILLLDLGSRF